MATQPTDVAAVVGEPLSGVSFVQDHVEFHFDGRIIRSLTRPTVAIGKVKHTFPDTGSRDALCSLIGQVAEKIEIRELEEMSIVFANRSTIRIPLSVNERSGPEAAHYVRGPNEPIAVWRSAGRVLDARDRCVFQA